jgi:hypothetical protein
MIGNSTQEASLLGSASSSTLKYAGNGTFTLRRGDALVEQSRAGKPGWAGAAEKGGNLYRVARNLVGDDGLEPPTSSV